MTALEFTYDFICRADGRLQDCYNDLDVYSKWIADKADSVSMGVYTAKDVSDYALKIIETRREIAHLEWTLKRLKILVGKIEDEQEGE